MFKQASYQSVFSISNWRRPSRLKCPVCLSYCLLHPLLRSSFFTTIAFLSNELSSTTLSLYCMCYSMWVQLCTGSFIVPKQCGVVYSVYDIQCPFPVYVPLFMYTVRAREGVIQLRVYTYIRVYLMYRALKSHAPPHTHIHRCKCNYVSPCTNSASCRITLHRPRFMYSQLQVHILCCTVCTFVSN